jgi:hypothetical protein
MKRMVNCPECNRQIALVGLRWHRITKHNIWPDKTNIVQAASDHDQANINPNVPVVQKVVQKAQQANVVLAQDSNDQNPQYCAECRQREFKIVDLEHEIAETRKSNAALQEQIDANNNRPIEIPDLNTIIEHCESGECNAHAKQWDQVKARIIQGAYDNLPPETIPDKLIEAEGLRRGFIPKKIIIPGRFLQT